MCGVTGFRFLQASGLCVCSRSSYLKHSQFSLVQQHTSLQTPNIKSSKHKHILDWTEIYQTHSRNNDVSNQQDATTFSFINLLLISLNQTYMFRAINSPILRSTFLNCIYSFGTMHNYNLSLQCIVPKAVYTVKRVLLRMGEFVARNMYG